MNNKEKEAIGIDRKVYMVPKAQNHTQFSVAIRIIS